MEEIYLKNKKIFKIIAIILSLIIILFEIYLYINLQFNWLEINSNNHQYENASLIIGNLFRFAVLIWGILLIPIVWLEYLLINLFIKFYNKYDGIKKILLCLISLLLMLPLFILFIKIIILIIISLK